MVEDSGSKRRSVLQLLGAGAVGGTSISQVAAAQENDIGYETLRGNSKAPLTPGKIRSARKRFIESRGNGRSEGPSTAVLDVSETVGDDRVIGYNIVANGNGVFKEQFAARGDEASNPGRGVADAEDRLQVKADEMLAQAVENAKGQRFTRLSLDANWSDWNSFGSTDLYYEWPKLDNDGDNARPGNIKFVHDIRRSPDGPRIGARSEIRMEPGRQLCNDGFDEYCTPTRIQDGYQNKKAVVFQDWDQLINETATDELITDTDPEGQITDVTTTRSVSLSLEASRDGLSGSVGYSSSVSMPGAELRDATSLAAGETEHKFIVNSAESPSSENNAVFEVGSAADYNTSCGSFNRQRYLDITVDLEWGLDAPLIEFGSVKSGSKDFYYYTYC